MSHNYRLGRWLGVDIRLHSTFVLLWAVLSLVQLVRHGALAATFTAFFTAAVFGIVLLHEMGHVLAARRFGIRTRDVTLYPIGGIASLEREPSNPRQELLVSLAGPAVNVGLALILAAVAAIVHSGQPAGYPALGSGMLSRLVYVNVAMAVFNLLPAFPLDGGRVLRALLEKSRGRSEATRIASRMGQLLAVGLGLYALVAGQFLLGLVALFIWVGANEELRRLTGVTGGLEQPSPWVVVEPGLHAAPRWQASQGYYRAPAGTGLDARPATGSVGPGRGFGVSRGRPQVHRGGSFFGGRRFFRR